jgi:hypothetical protein
MDAMDCPDASPVVFAATPLGRKIAPLFPFTTSGLLIVTCSVYTPGQI